MTTWKWILVGAGAILAGVSLWGLSRARRGVDEPGRGLSPAALTCLGLSGLLAAYHALSYGLPAGWLALRVPPGRLWIAGIVVALAIGASLALDRLDRRAASEGV